MEANMFKINLTKFAIILLVLSFPTLSFAANHYIRAGASGNGSGDNWTNAHTTFPSNLVRGDTYFVAGGTYGGQGFDTAPSGTNYVYIVKATPGNHGTDVGWSDTYGTSVANFTSTVTFETDYWVFDGVTGNGDGSTEAYGFKITTSACTSDSKLLRIDNGADFINISHIEMEHCGINNSSYRQDCVYIVSSSDGGSSYINFSHCYMHDVNRVMMLYGYVTNSTVEHCFFERRKNTSVHGEAMSINFSGTNANNTIRYNTFKDIYGTGVLVIKDSVQGLFYIYGNLFYQTSDQFEVHNGSITNTGGDTNTHMYVYNNSFINFTASGNYNVGIRWDNGSNNYAYNNLWVNCRNISFSGTNHDYNAFDGSSDYGEANAQIGLDASIFRDYADHNFQLTRPTESGKSDLGSPYNVDMRGVVRGADGVWDRGAFEYDPSQSPSDDTTVTTTTIPSTTTTAPEAPEPPTGLEIIIE